MKNIKTIAVLLMLVIFSGIILSFALRQESELVEVNDQNQIVNLFVTHGHCSTPFMGGVENLKVITSDRDDGGNPLEDMKISFDMNPKTFNVCAGKGLTEKIQTPGLFFEEQGDAISFRTTQVYTMGLDWYQINGMLTIKGIEKSVKFFASGIRDSKESTARFLVLEGQFDLTDWGIDYDRIVNGKSDAAPTKMMHLNMKVDLENL